MTQKIIPHLWFDKEAVEAAEFYSSVFINSKIIRKSIIHDTPSGDNEIIEFTIQGYTFRAISAGPLFKFNPSISFFLNFDPSRENNSVQDLNLLWDKMSKGGKILMPLQEYPFSKRFGWLEDKYGVSWQFIFSDPDNEVRPFIIPALLFVGSVCGKAEEAIQFYQSIFKKFHRGITTQYPKGMEPEIEGTLMFADFRIENQWFAAMDSANMHNFSFNEAISFIIQCENQREIDYYWDNLSAVPESEQCGWVKDKYGISWQIVPANMEKLLSKNPKKVTSVMLKMKKLIIEDLQRAGEGR